MEINGMVCCGMCLGVECWVPGGEEVGGGVEVKVGVSGRCVRC